ncbi:MAG: hypothetical protein V4525_08835 [Pseudomonadota bacterium]
MKKLMIAAMLAAATITGQVFAHGAEPKHGGIAKTANDLQFELVVETQSATLYIEDHGAPVATAGAKGKLSILNGTEKTEVALQHAGANTLEVKNVPQLKKGAKIIAHVTLADGKDVNVRFSLK